MASWQLWRPGVTLRCIPVIQPLLASWERKAHPAQVRLQAYLADLKNALGPKLSDATRPLARGAHLEPFLVPHRPRCSDYG